MQEEGLAHWSDSKLVATVAYRGESSPFGRLPPRRNAFLAEW
jgi:hypothetical protein